MSDRDHRPPGTAAALRASFDRGFAEAPGAAVGELVDLLAIRLGGDPYALRVAEIASLHVDRKVVPLPGDEPSLLGLSGLRGVMVPVHDLRVLVGVPGGPPPRAFVLARASQPLLLAFDLVETHVRVEQASLSAPEAHDPSGRHVRGTVRVAGTIRPLIHVASIVEAIAGRTRAGGPPGEQ